MQKKLFDQFPPVTTKEWMERINADLKGADFNKRLVWRTGEGFDVMPFYRREDLENIKHPDVFLPLILKGVCPPTSGRRGSGNFKQLACKTKYKGFRLFRREKKLSKY